MLMRGCIRCSTRDLLTTAVCSFLSFLLLSFYSSPSFAQLYITVTYEMSKAVIFIW